ncbi:hypothetical protein CERSUDRAFT_114245 [Gelatoporia subvermispora B]|uniref:Zn(2)-C6 fungal-type domain-containing protein n=1 Tax=Ceriporiopsis subvermispora (strain B) TaxID=914234 RepID=M2RGK5_CERS8|nr:hypothetical protein CERSUDRAFT_114245 [Gelatoporia subvermispora B]
MSSSQQSAPIKPTTMKTESSTSQAPLSNSLSSRLMQPQAESSQTGKISKMRRHGGNIPSLPQTKLCPLCSAKFTRTTHLNRHMRTHSNERLHECDRCHSQFTRSDLLTRHKRSCGDPAHAGRSRRKSCQACADSKIKCDLQRPCSKCVARKRECIYVTGPDVMPQKSSPQLSDATTSPTNGDSQASSSPTLANSSQLQHSDPTPPEHPGSSSHSSDSMASTSPSLPAVPETPQSGIPASASSTVWDVFNHPQNNDAMMRNRPGDGKTPARPFPEDFIPNELFDDLVFSNIFPAQADWQDSFVSADDIVGDSATPDVADTDVAAALDISAPHSNHFETTFLFPLDNNLSELSGTGTTSPAVVDPVDGVTVGLGVQAQAPLEGDAIPTTGTASRLTADPTSPPEEAPRTMVQAGSSEHSDSELRYYYNLYLNAYHHNMPLIHLPTWCEIGKPPILLSAMRACGALYVRTRAATDYIDSTLASARDELIAEFAQNPKDHEQQTYLALAAVLIQTIGLFHGQHEQRASSTVYHGMIMMMIWMSGFVQSTANWRPPPIDNCASARRAWREWALHEMAKRALVVCYLHDSVHSMYYNLRPTFPSDEFNIGLPCEDALWTATCPEEWVEKLKQPSLYGDLSQRLCGTFLQDIYSKLAVPDPTFNPILMQTAFAQQVTIHAIIRRFFEAYLEEHLPELDAQKDHTVPTVPHPVSQERIYLMQLMLHRWLQSWMQSPETAQVAPNEEPPFMFNPLPFYWFAQVAVLAYQEGQPPFDQSRTFLLSNEAKFRLMKRWEGHVRAFVRKGEQQPMLVWDELMAIRLQSWRAVLASGGERVNADANLMGFFPES